MDDPAKDRCIYGYVRVSSDDQLENGRSLLLQEAKLKQFADDEIRKNPTLYTSYRCFREEGVSAWSNDLGDRHQGRVMLTMLRPGDCVVFASIDRAFRSQRDGATTLEFLMSRGIRAVFLDALGSQVDLATPVGKLLFGFQTGIAQYYSDVNSDRITNIHAFNLRTRGFSVDPAYGHKIVGEGRARVAVYDQKQATTAALLMDAYIRDGVDAAYERICNGEFTIGPPKSGRQSAARPPRTMKNRYSVRYWVKAVTVLTNLDLAMPWCETRGYNPARMFDPSGRILSYDGSPCNYAVDIAGQPQKDAVHANSAKRRIDRPTLPPFAKPAAAVADGRRGVGLPQRSTGKPVPERQLLQDAGAAVVAGSVD